MADISIPAPIVTWMQAREWGPHHLEWHLTRTWDVWHARAAAGDANAAQVVAFINAQGWSRASTQEGGPDNGLEFLAMHRAMIQLLKEAFPADAALFAGWSTPPQNPADADDPVPGGAAFDADKAGGIAQIEGHPELFPTENGYGVFIQTMLRWSAANPLGQTTDTKSGVHNYLHRRWTDTSSTINLGDPEVNLFNTRFWKLHGWIDRAWGAYRLHHGLSDTSPEYTALIAHYRAHMGGAEHDHHAMATRAAKRTAVPRPAVLKDLFGALEDGKYASPVK
jgi:hypothetical protein